MIFGKFLLGIVVGFFVVPAIVSDPQGTIDTATNVVNKIIEVAGFVGGIVS